MIESAKKWLETCERVFATDKVEYVLIRDLVTEIDRLRAMYALVDPCHSCAYIQHIDGCPDEYCNHGNGFIDWIPGGEDD